MLVFSAISFAKVPFGRKMYAPDALWSSLLLSPLIPAYHRKVWLTCNITYKLLYVVQG